MTRIWSASFIKSFSNGSCIIPTSIRSSIQYKPSSHSSSTMLIPKFLIPNSPFPVQMVLHSVLRYDEFRLDNVVDGLAVTAQLAVAAYFQKQAGQLFSDLEVTFVDSRQRYGGLKLTLV